MNIDEYYFYKLNHYRKNENNEINVNNEDDSFY